MELQADVFGLTLVIISSATISIAALLLSKTRRKGKPSVIPELQGKCPFYRGHLANFTEDEKAGSDIMELARRLNEITQYGIAYLRVYFRTGRLIIFNVKDLKQLFVENGASTSGRALQLQDYAHLNEVENGIVTIDGELSKTNRKIFANFVKKFGKEALAEVVEKEATFLVEALEKIQGPCNPSIYFQMASANVTCALILGRRYDYCDPDYSKLVNDMIEINECSTIIPYGFRKINRWINIIPSLKRKSTHLASAKGFIRKRILEILREYNPENIETMIEAFIYESNQPGYPVKFSIENTVNVVYEILFAGTDTTGTTLLWAMACMARHQEIQKRIQCELTEKLGDGVVTPETLKNLNYTVASCYEIQRIGSIGWWTFAHRVTNDVNFNGCHIPKNTLLHAGLYAIMRDRNAWKEPFEFHPGNFLDEQGNINKPESFVPYGIGPRMCTGNTIADMEVKVFIINLLRRFGIGSTDNIDISKRFIGVTASPGNYNYQFTQR